MKKKLIIPLCIFAFSMSTACGSKTPENAAAATVNTQADTTTTVAPEETAITPTASEPPEVSTETAENISEISLETYLEQHPDSLGHHLLFDVALNENGNSTSDEGVTYMFSKDAEGKQIPGNVMAYYSKTSIKGEERDTYCTAFINKYLPELEIFFIEPEIHDDNSGYGQIITFSDYSITLLPDKNLEGMTVILSAAKQK